jgi:hypothetical protein
MTDVTGDQSAEGAPAPEPEVEQPEAPAPDDAETGSQDGGEDELEEVEFEGAKFQVPKSAKDALEKGALRQADYTKKTQGLADDRRALEAEKASNEALFEDKVKARQIQSHIEALDDAINQGHERFQNIDWAALKTLPDGDMRLQQAQIELRSLENNRQKLAEQHAKLTGEITEKAKTAGLAQQQLTAKQIEQRDAVLTKEVPGWAKLKPEVEAFAVKNGITKAELDGTADPRIFKMLRYAKLGQEAEQRGRATGGADEETPAATPAMRPATTLTNPSRRTVSTSSKESMRLSPEEWQRNRNAELAARNQRPAPRR